MSRIDKIRITNETPWRTEQLAAIVSAVRKGAPEDSDHVPELLIFRCGRANDRKRMEQRCVFRRKGQERSTAIATRYDTCEVIVPCDDFPVRALASSLARGFNLLNNPDHTLRPLRERVLAVRVIKAAGRLPLTRVGRREERWPTKPNPRRSTSK